ncbi:MAG TPA: FecR domain-containing protein [Armatimonadota bacterium]
MSAFSKSVLTILLLSILIYIPKHALSEEKTAHITAVVLDVTYQLKPDGKWIKAEVGTQLPIGSRVRTARRSKCEVKFPGGSMVRLAPRGELLVSAVTGESNRVKLVSGQVLVNAIKGSALDVEGYKATVAVQGTWVLFDGETSSVWDGQVELQTSSGKMKLGDREKASVSASQIRLVTSEDVPTGSVTALIEKEDLVLTLNTSGEFGFMSAEVYAARKAPDTETFNTFPHKQSDIKGSQSVTFRIPTAELGEPLDSPIYIAVHASLANSLQGGKEQSTWAEGTPFGTENGMYFTPDAVALSKANPLNFATGTPASWWQGLRPGVNTRTTPGTSVGAEIRDEQLSLPVPPFGNPGRLDVIVRSLPMNSFTSQAVAAPSSTQSSSGFPTGTAAFGKTFFEPRSQVDVFGMTGPGSTFGGLRARANSVTDSMYFEIGYTGTATTDSESSGSISEAFMVLRAGDIDFTGGRQRYLNGIANNNTLGSLFSFTSLDGIRAHYDYGKLGIDAAWVDSMNTGILEPDEIGGWLGRLSCPIGAAQMGVTVFDQRHADFGSSVDLSVPVFPGALDVYGEIGQDSRNRKLATAGIYLPGLYQRSGTDIFLEYAYREGFSKSYSALITQRLGVDWTGVLAIRKTSDSDYEAALGFVKRFGKLSD